MWFSFGCSCVLNLRCILDILPPHLSCAASTHGELCLSMLGVCACYESRDAMLYASVEVSEYVIVSNEIKFRFFLVCPPLCSGVCSQLLSWYFVTRVQPCCFHLHVEQCLSILAVCLYYISIDTVLLCYCEPLPFCWPGHGRILYASGEAIMTMLQ